MELSTFVQPGMVNELEFEVEEQHTARQIGSGAMRVLATPSMILFMERTSHRLLMQHLPAGYSSVGIHVDVHHLAPTPMGRKVHVKSEIIQVDGLRVTFRVQAWDDQEKVGEGNHQRAVVDERRFLRRVEAKAAG